MIDIFNQIKRFNNIDLKVGEAFSFILPKKSLEMNVSERVLTTSNNTVNNLSVEDNRMAVNGSYRVTVKKYMTEPATREFDFQDKWNNGVPMPLCVMQGKVIKETRGMYYMNLKGTAKQTCICSVCGKKLTNPISMIYGIGPECNEKIGLIRIDTEEEAKEKYEEIKNHLVDIKWEGWVIKSSIKEWEAITG